MAQAIDLPRNEAGIATALGILKQQFGDRFHTGQAMRDQHAHTTTWIRAQAPDAVVFPASTQKGATCLRGKNVRPYGEHPSLRPCPTWS